LTNNDCPFCQISKERIAFSKGLCIALWDGFPVTEGHLLLVPKRHIPIWADLSEAERAELTDAIGEAQRFLRARFALDGFNVGFNEGRAGGQTVPHFHIHVIPRRSGDVANPRGGVRHVIPAKADYLASPRPALATTPHAPALISGDEEDALIRHLLPHIDDSHSIDLVVSFVLDSGVRLLQPRLEDLLKRGGRLRIVTGDYLDVTEPSALRRLLDLEGNVHHWVFEADTTSFHPKSWIFHYSGNGGIAVVGSSNLSETALKSGIEWNYRVYDQSMKEGWQDVVDGFDRLLTRPELRTLTHEWIDEYEKRRVEIDRPRRVFAEVEAEPPLPPVIPHAIQLRALTALKETRAVGFTAGLVVLATGLGKTWLSAFDSEGFQRILFVAHREEILNQAMATFRRIRPAGRFGRYTGEEKDLKADVLFASIQTLGRVRHLRNFPSDSFDYIIVDEFHHAAARTYRTLIEHFTPKFLLGLTATPERTDGGDLFGLCQENLVFRCDLFEGIKEQLLSPFHYFGVPDDVDYAQIPWRSTAFDETALTEALATQKRAQNAFEQFQKHGGSKAIGFCCSILHADFMMAFFKDKGLRAAAIHSGATSAPRVTALEQLQSGGLDIVFAVDILNEGVDLPDIDTILMLRPTESSIIWLQQFGRGLRISEKKERLTVVDYIGNHRVFLTKARALLNVREGDRALALALENVKKREFEFPLGCDVTYELKALEILQKLLRPTRRGDAIEAFYIDFRERHGTRPTALETFHAGFGPRMTGHGGWFGFVSHMGDLSAEEQEVYRRHGPFLQVLSTTQMTKSYKMLLLKAMMTENAFPGEITLDALTSAFTALAVRNPKFRNDVTVPLDKPAQVSRLLVDDPIAAWTGGKGTGGTKYFSCDGRNFRSTFTVDRELLPSFHTMVAELVDFRIGQYLGRGGDKERSRNRDEPLVLWKEYMREDIAHSFGEEFTDGKWNRGMVRAGDDLILMMTLDKGDLAAGNQYVDKFIDAKTFQWHTQDQTAKSSKHGKMISGEAAGARVHLFVRRAKLREGTAAPFTYCGEISFVNWTGEKPITVTSMLRARAPERLHRLFQIGMN
jgi:superfamily II DNA or RNA helicase/diadenosine tetraphosphate (Ap4A) HIT family hydrolase